MQVQHPTDFQSSFVNNPGLENAPQGEVPKNPDDNNFNLSIKKDKLNFITSQLSEAQEKAKIKTSHSAFRGNFAKTKAKFLQNVANRNHRNFGSEVYGCAMFVKRNIINLSLRTQVLVKKFHW